MTLGEITHRILQSVAHRFGYSLNQYWREKPFPENPDFSEDDAEIIRFCRPFTMTSAERLYALVNAVRYILTHNIPGDVVECGVWKGGSTMAVARTLISLGHPERDLYLFDTYEGMTKPLEADADFLGGDAGSRFEAAQTGPDSSDFCRASIEGVKQALSITKYPRERLHFVKGKVEDTIPAHAPDQIAILRLDTDWYESTRHELLHLFPRLSPGGVLVIDDYGHWQGCKKAVDEYFGAAKIPILLNRIDYTGRIGIKPDSVIIQRAAMQANRDQVERNR